MVPEIRWGKYDSGKFQLCHYSRAIAGLRYWFSLLKDNLLFLRYMERDINVTAYETVLYLNLAGNAVFPIIGVLFYLCAHTPPTLFS